MIIRPLAEEEEPPYALLLDADPSRPMVDKYLHCSQTFVALLDGEVMGVYVLYSLNATTMELKNIAVAEQHQNRGFGTLLLRDAEAKASAAGAAKLLIATSNASIGPLYLYQREGFDLVAFKRNYFLIHYSESMLDDGIPVRHQLVLEKEL